MFVIIRLTETAVSVDGATPPISEAAYARVQKCS
jgi:hypothetical protein